jgi:hypothetical protein
MKKYLNKFIKIAGLIFVSALMLVSCDQWIDTDINIDPDAPADVPINLIMPGIQQTLGYVMCGNDMVLTTNNWMQQFDGVTRQSHTIARYQYLPSDVNNLWSTMYSDILINSNILVRKAEQTEGKESPYNAGVGKVVMATTLGLATDVFGDMPFREALKGDQNVLTPKFDSQDMIYDTLMTILDGAIADFGKPAADNKLPVNGDVIYGGNITKWKKAAHSIKARHLLQTSKVNGDAAYTQALAAAANGFSSNADNMMVPWESANRNPIFQFMEQRGDVRMGSTFIDLLKSIEDPRLPFYSEVDGDGEYTGSVIGSQNENASKPGSYVAGAEVSSVVMSYAELKFIVAEANFMLNNSEAAITALKEAVGASVAAVTGEAMDEEWYNTYVGSQTLSMELIMTQKYIASFGTNQAYADYRRVGLPVLTPHPDGVLPAIPTRYPYAQSEIDYNAANTPSVSISDKLWWDK